METNATENDTSRTASEVRFPADPPTAYISGQNINNVPSLVDQKHNGVSMKYQGAKHGNEIDVVAAQLMDTEQTPLLPAKPDKKFVAAKLITSNHSKYGAGTMSLTGSLHSSLSTFWSTSFKKLQKSVGFAHGFLFISGALIGSGIFLSPSLVVRTTDDVGVTLIIWFVCGVIAFLGSLCYCELGCAIRSAGGSYAYILKAYGPVVAFLCSWSTVFVTQPAALATVALTFGTYLEKPFVEEGQFPWLPKILAVSLILMVTFANSWSVKAATRAGAIFTMATILVVLFIIVLGIWQVAKGETDNFKTMFNVTTTGFTPYRIGQLGMAFYSGLWAYDGWVMISNVTEEMHNLERNLFLSIVTAIPFVIICYLAINCSLMTVLSKKELASSITAPITFVQRILGKKAAYIMPVFVALSCYGAANGNVFSCSRLTLAASREGHMPDVLSMVHRKRLTPIPAILITAILAGVMLVPDGTSLETLVQFFNFTCWINYGLAIFAVIMLRIRKPDLARPYKVWIITPLIMTLVSLSLVVIPFINKPVESSIALGIVLSGLPAYVLFVHKESSHPWFFRKFRESITKLLKCRMNLAPCRL